ncbi:hypothetical protein EV2_037298 [Malus domestica]
MIHRAVLGSLKRFFGVLREHYAGDFPLWLSPVQAHVLPVTDSQRFDSFVDSESLKDSATDSPIFHSSAVDNAFATQPASEAFSPPLIYAESNGRGFDGGFGGSDDPILPAPSEMLPEEGFALREWRGRKIHGSWHDHGHGHEVETLLAISKLLKELTKEEDMKVHIWISSA